jgi:hypothetical protein
VRLGKTFILSISVRDTLSACQELLLSSIVSVWLREADLQEESHEAAKFIAAANHRLENPVVAMEELSTPKLGPSLIVLFTRQYWKRLWIVQEALLATDLVFLCGNDVFRWSSLATLFQLLGAVSISSGSIFHGINELVDPLLASPARGRLFRITLAPRRTRRAF